MKKKKKVLAPTLLVLWALLALMSPMLADSAHTPEPIPVTEVVPQTPKPHEEPEEILTAGIPSLINHPNSIFILAVPVAAAFVLVRRKK